MPGETVIAQKGMHTDWNGYFSAAYEELRLMAARLLRKDGRTLDPTALVNETWLRLSRSASIGRESHEHFRSAVARAMRHVLIDDLRRRKATKRGGVEEYRTLSLDEAIGGVSSSTSDLIALNYALDELERVNIRQAKVVEYRYFGGYSVREIAEILNIADATVHRDWRGARAWLRAHVLRP